MSQKKQYVIVTIKSWNVDNFEKYFGKKKNFHLITKKEDLTVKNLEKINPDFVFFPHWSWIIPREIWARFECVVFHMTDVPYGRGGTPLQNLIVRGHKTTKISAIKVNGGLDTGPVYIKRSLSLSGSAQDIFKRFSEIVYTKLIPKISQEDMVPKEQKGTIVEFSRRTPEMSCINGNETQAELYDRIRMVDADSYPKAYVEVGNKKFEFSDARLAKGTLHAKVTITEQPKK